MPPGERDAWRENAQYAEARRREETPSAAERVLILLTALSEARRRSAISAQRAAAMPEARRYALRAVCPRDMLRALMLFSRDATMARRVECYAIHARAQHDAALCERRQAMRSHASGGFAARR